MSETLRSLRPLSLSQTKQEMQGPCLCLSGGSLSNATFCMGQAGAAGPHALVQGNTHSDGIQGRVKLGFRIPQAIAQPLSVGDLLLFCHLPGQLPSCPLFLLPLLAPRAVITLSIGSATHAGQSCKGHFFTRSTSSCRINTHSVLSCSLRTEISCGNGTVLPAWPTNCC
jgi:hypothetical protein